MYLHIPYICNPYIQLDAAWSHRRYYLHGKNSGQSDKQGQPCTSKQLIIVRITV